MRLLFFCVLITLGLLGIFYILGKAFLVFIHGEQRISDCILFGFLTNHIFFQIVYLPFLLSRGSFNSLAIIWTVVLILILVGLWLNLRKRMRVLQNRTIRGIIPAFRRKICEQPRSKIILFFLAIVINCFLCWYIGCRPTSTPDTVQYIKRMNEMVYQDILWNNGHMLEIHQGMNSFYSLFAVVSWLTGIKPLYICCFTIRFLGVVFASLIGYRFGVIAFREKAGIYPMVIAILVPLAMMLWNTLYGTGRFFYERSTESKAFCQILLFPLSVSVMVQMFQEGNERKLLWTEQLTIGLSAVPIAVSSLSIYPVILFVGMVGLLVFNRCKNWLRTIQLSLLCAIPNLLYMGFYVLYQKQILRF